MRIPFALVGAGAMGTNHARVLAQMPEAELVAVVDADAERAQAVARRHGGQWFTSVEEMLRESFVQAACVAVPTALHKSVGTALLEESVNVLMEKPLAQTTAEGAELLAAARRGHALLAVGHIERYNPAVLALKRLISLGRLGQISTIVTRRLGGPPRPGSGTNVLLDLAIHDVDVIGFLLDLDPTEALATLGQQRPSGETCRGELLLRYGHVSAFIQASWLTAAKVRTMEVTGTRGIAQLDFAQQALSFMECAVPDLEGAAETGRPIPGPSAPEWITVEKSEPLAGELRAFCEFLQGHSTSIVTGGEGLAALAAIETALRGRIVVLA